MWNTDRVTFFKDWATDLQISLINLTYKYEIICNPIVICLNNSWIFTLKNCKASTKGQIKHSDELTL